MTRFGALLLILSALTFLHPGAAIAGDDVRVEEIEFESHGARLSGSIILPKSGKIHAALVFIHGAGPQTRGTNWGERFAATGIAALVYDKRGVGRSGGTYEGEQNVGEKNILLLADDAAAALKALASHPSLKEVPVGFAGISQAGWIAPIAAQKSSLAKFLVLWSGPVCKVSEEDIYSKFTGDMNAGTAPPYQQALDARTQKYIWPDFLGRDTDSSEDLGRLSIPGLWIFGDNDTSIPVDLSIARLQALQRAGHKYDYRVFPGVGHNNMDATFEFATQWIRKLHTR